MNSIIDQQRDKEDYRIRNKSIMEQMKEVQDEYSKTLSKLNKALYEAKNKIIQDSTR